MENMRLMIQKSVDIEWDRRWKLVRAFVCKNWTQSRKRNEMEKLYEERNLERLTDGHSLKLPQLIMMG